MELVLAGTHPRAYRNPREIIVAQHAAEVLRALAHAQCALDEGRHLAGFFSYELAGALLPRLEHLPRGDDPLLALGVYDAPAEPPRVGAEPYLLTPLTSGISGRRYARDIAAIRAAIGEGELYQANYTVPFHFGFRGDPWTLFQNLLAASAPGHAAYLRWGERALLSCSPELFLALEGSRIVAKPMKGTASHDAIEQLHSAKNRAEHVMIVDLLRNDLHRICTHVAVERLFEIERYPTYATMTSTIVGELREGIALHELLAATFPCGSITGAPKIAAMQHIARLERRARGPFTGSIGYLAPDHTGSWNVAIRTARIDLTCEQGVIEIGGGIVADSTAQSEWQEVLIKRRFIADLAPRFDIVETLRRDADGTYPALHAHLARLERSADALGYAYDRAAAERALCAVAAAPGGGALLVRLALSEDGRLVTTTRALSSAPEPVSVAIAPMRLRSADALLRHKTSWRPVHEAASRWASQHGLFEALLCNEQGELADGARTTLFALVDGHLRTPPLAGGALGGILRERLLAAGTVRERVLVPDDLARAQALYVGNSARGLLRARLLLQPLSLGSGEQAQIAADALEDAQGTLELRTLERG